MEKEWKNYVKIQELQIPRQIGIMNEEKKGNSAPND